MTQALLVYISTFISVFALGFQSQNVNQGHYWSALFTSLAIGGSTLVLYKALPDSGFWEIVGYLVGGATGIVSAMWAHRRTLGRPAAEQPKSEPDWGLANSMEQEVRALRTKLYQTNEALHYWVSRALRWTPSTVTPQIPDDADEVPVWTLTADGLVDEAEYVRCTDGCHAFSTDLMTTSNERKVKAWCYRRPPALPAWAKQETSEPAEASRRMDAQMVATGTFDEVGGD